MSAPGMSAGMLQQSTSGPAEKSALDKIMWFGIVQLVGLVAGWVVSFYAFYNLFFTSAFFNLPPNPTPSQVSSAMTPMFQSLTVFVPVSLGIELVAMILLIIGLREFGNVDRASFSVPSKLIYLLVIGNLIAVGTLIPFLNSIPAIIAQAPGTPGATPSSAFFSAISSLLFYALLLFIGGILALIGLIGGQILGLWRVGTRYNETLIKLGAIFVIIPLLNVVAPIVILIGAYSAKGRLGTI